MAAAGSGLKLTLKGKRPDLPPKRGKVLGSILEDLMMKKLESDPNMARSNGISANYVPKRGLIKLKILEEWVQIQKDPSGAPTSPVPRRGMIQLKILEELVQIQKDPVGAPTRSVPRRGMIKFKILEEIGQIMVPLTS